MSNTGKEIIKKKISGCNFFKPYSLFNLLITEFAFNNY